jgi:hypothetical protein
LFRELRREAIVRFVDICGIVDHYFISYHNMDGFSLDGWLRH